MSWIRLLEGRYVSKGKGLYVYPTTINGVEYVHFTDIGSIPSEDFIEVLYRILRRAGIKLTLYEVNAIRKQLFLDPIKRIASDWDVDGGAYFPREFYDEDGSFKIRIKKRKNKKDKEDEEVE